MKKEFKTKSLKAWEEILNDIFKNEIPTQKTWNNKVEIIEILNIIGAKKNLNHTFFPGGGGMDLDGAQDSIEDECIDLIFGNVHMLVKPMELSFQSFGVNYEWSYFRLETEEIMPSGTYDDISEEWKREEVVVLPNNHYVNRNAWDEGEFYNSETDEMEELPSGSYLMVRNRKGSFVIFAKGSLYNEVPITYDGRHNKMTAEEFEKHIRDNYKDDISYEE